MKLIKYQIETVSINESAGPLESDCNTLTVINYGTAVLLIDDVVTLAQNQEYIIEGNVGEINVTKHRYRFTGAGTQIAIVIRKKYLSEGE